MRRKNKWIQIMAFLALFWIIIWIIGTGILILFSGNNTSTNNKTLSPEQYTQIQKLIENQSWTTIKTKTLTWETK